MAGMDACTPISQVKKQIERTCASGSEHQGKKTSSGGMDTYKKVPHQG